MFDKMSKNQIRNLNKNKIRGVQKFEIDELGDIKMNTKLAGTKELKRLNDEKLKKLTKSTTKKEKNQQYVRLLKLSLYRTIC